jgi:hypothetical protein
MTVPRAGSGGRRHAGQPDARWTLELPRRAFGLLPAAHHAPRIACAESAAAGVVTQRPARNGAPTTSRVGAL